MKNSRALLSSRLLMIAQRSFYQIFEETKMSLKRNFPRKFRKSAKNFKRSEKNLDWHKLCTFENFVWNWPFQTFYYQISIVAKPIFSASAIRLLISSGVVLASSGSFVSNQCVKTSMKIYHRVLRVLWVEGYTWEKH